MLYPIFAVDYIINLDGPTHVYNAAIYNRLLMGDEFVQQFYVINPDPVPNYFASVLLSLINAIFTSLWTLKLFHLLYVVAFTYFFFKWNKSSLNILWLTFLPLVYSGMFFNGFYNFIWGLIFLFVLLWLYEKETSSIKKLLFTTLLLGVIYFSHSFVFMCAGFVLIIYEVTSWIKSKSGWRALFKKLAFLALTASPYFILSIFFLNSRTSGYYHLPLDVLWNELITSRSLIERAEFAKILKYLFTLSIASAALFLIIRHFNRFKTPYLLFSALFFLCLYFIFPESIGNAGVFSIRIAYLFWIFLVAWLIRNGELLHSYFKISVGLIGLTFLIAQLITQTNYWQKLSSDAHLLLEANVAPDDSTIYPVFSSNCWEHLHISNLLGIDNNYAILENNAARNDYFSVRYKAPVEENLKTRTDCKFEVNDSLYTIDYILKIGKNKIEGSDSLIFQLARSKGRKVFENRLVEMWEITP